MSRCPFDTDRLLQIAIAFDFKIADGVRHITECDECREMLAQLTAVQDALTEEIEPAPGFVDSVVRGRPSAAPRSQSGGPRMRVLDFVTPVLAGGTAFFAIGLAAADTALSFGLPVVLVSLGTAAMTLAWNQWDRRSAIGNWRSAIGS